VNGYDYERLARIEAKAEVIAARIEQRNAAKAEREAERAKRDQEDQKPAQRVVDPEDLAGGMDPYDMNGDDGSRFDPVQAARAARMRVFWR
jgi:hypothetical protein